MPARKKDPSARARANKASTAATLHRVADDTTPREVFEAMTVPQLREAIERANLTRPGDMQIPTKGTKTVLVDALSSVEGLIPSLPRHPPRWVGEGEESYQVDVDWHVQTEAWWNDVWLSPMASEWDDSDLHNVFVVALLYNDIWTASTAKERKDALAEYRLQRADLGLSPYARRRLEWVIESADEAKDRGAQRRRQPAPPAKGAQKRPDPRGLHAVN